MKSKVLVWSIVAILVLGLGAGAYWWLFRPQIIVLGDGTKLTLVGVTYGKHHSSPIKQFGGHKIQSGLIDTTNDSLCIWVHQKHKPNDWPNYQLIAYDSANTGCAGDYTRTYGNFNGPNQTEQVMGIVFTAFPRRGGKIIFHVQSWNNRNGKQEVSTGTFAVSNPARSSSFTRWAPDALPDTQQDGDLQVILTRLDFKSGAFGYGGRQNKAGDPASQGVLTSFRAEQNGAVVTNWQPVSIETSDGTGNLTRNRSWSNSKTNDEEMMTYQWGLWPNEPAWKLRVEMSRTSGYTDAETWSPQGLALKPGNMNDMWQQPGKDVKPAAETTLGDIQLQVFQPIQVNAKQARNFGGNNIEGFLRIHTDPAPDGYRLALVKVTDDQGRVIESQNWGWGGQDYRFGLKKLGDAKSINLTLVLHRSRYVEFTVAPPKKK